MAGAIIPNDWDGSTFECMRVEWPASDLWQAILLGQISEPSRESYWDADTGDAEAAGVAVQNGYRLTIPAIYGEGCDVTPGIPVPTFYAYKTSFQAIAAETWTEVQWDALWWNWNTPQFDLAAEAHIPANADLLGLWHYDLSIRLTVDTRTLLKFHLQPDNIDIATVEYLSGVQQSISLDYPHPITGHEVTCEVWSELANSIIPNTNNSWWDGHFLGPLSE